MEEYWKYFETSLATVAQLPHVLVRNPSDVFRFIVDVTGASPGIWGAAAPFDKAGTYVGTFDLLFREWTTPHNQEYVIRKVTREYGSFSINNWIVLDARCDESDLEALLSTSPNDMHHGTESWLNDKLVALVNRCGWVSILLFPDSLYHLFVTSEHHRVWVEDVKAKCRQHRIPSAKLMLDGAALRAIEEG